MINKDYILRLVERFGRALAVILQLREYNQHEEALIYIDDLLLKTIGLTSRFINSLPEETLIQTFSPLGLLNVNSCLTTAILLKQEGEIYEDQDNTTESYYRYVKSLHLFLSILLHEPTATDAALCAEVTILLDKLAEYAIPLHTQKLLFAYYEHIGHYAQAEDLLFDLLEETTYTDSHLLAQGHAFYQRLLSKSTIELQAGNLSHEEVEEGITQLKQIADKKR